MRIDYLRSNGWNLSFSGGRGEYYIHHHTAPGAQPVFVARFKYARAKSSAVHFARFLAANFTPEEYFAARNANPQARESSPLGILESKGYISLNKQRALQTMARQSSML